MKKIALRILIILFLPTLIYAQEDMLYASENLVINLDVSSEAMINPTSSDYNVKYIDVNLSHYPYKDFEQEVVSLDMYPPAKIENNTILFNWQNPTNKINFGYKAKIKTGSYIAKVNNKVNFPILELPDEVKQFTMPSEIINSDDEDVVGYAGELAEGEDDLYVVVNKIAEWTKNNIRYDLSTLTAEVSQKASWVLDYRQGVCDELTSLFIAMLRALGIPAKFISGVAYTNSPLFPENWGSHGWAEVYFPGYGWVPYDVTYGQFGYLDATHVKLKESLDSNEPSVMYRWMARNIELDTHELDIKAVVEEEIGRVKEPVSLGISALKENVGFGSYNLIEVVLENKEDYYISSEVFLSMPKELHLIGEPSKNVVLKPKEIRRVFWITKLKDELEDNYIYTLPITASTLKGAKAETSFKSKKESLDYSLAEINNILRQEEEEERKFYSKQVDINCEIKPKEFYYYESSKVYCKMKNTGNTLLKELNVCFEDNCTKTDLGIMQERSFNYSVKKPVAGKQESIFMAKNADISKAEYIGYVVLDKPDIKITEIKIPKEVEYNNNFKIEFLLSKNSLSVPKNVEVILLYNNVKQTWELKELTESRKIIVNMIGKGLRKGFNEIMLNAKYEDGNGRNYEINETTGIELVNVTFFQSIVLVLNHMVNFY